MANFETTVDIVGQNSYPEAAQISIPFVPTLVTVQIGTDKKVHANIAVSIDGMRDGANVVAGEDARRIPNVQSVWLRRLCGAGEHLNVTVKATDGA